MITANDFKFINDTDDNATSFHFNFAQEIKFLLFRLWISTFALYVIGFMIPK